MKELISLENISLMPVSKEILELNEYSGEYGLSLTAEEARELSETRNRSLTENDRIEMGAGAVVKLIKRFCTSKYIGKEDYSYILNELTYLFYYIKTETDDNVSDGDLIEEMYERFELFCRGSIDTFETREVERIIRKINSGKNYYKWYKDRDELDYNSKEGLREAPGNVVREEYGLEHFTNDEELADHDYYEKDTFEDYEMYEEDDDLAAELDAFDEFLDSEAISARDNADVNIAKEDADDDDDDDECGDDCDCHHHEH